MVNGESQPLPPGGTLDEVLAAAGLAGRPVAIEVDGEVVPRSGFADRRLAGGERIEIVTASHPVPDAAGRDAAQCHCFCFRPADDGTDGAGRISP